MILFLAGTSDARELALQVKKAGYSLLTTVVTESAANSMEETGLPVRIGRLTEADLIELIQEEGFQAIVDASHPFAEEAHKNALSAAKATGIPYIRYERENAKFPDHNLITVVEGYKEAAELAAEKKGVIMLTTGSKTLKIFAERLLGQPDTTMIIRMLPRVDNLQKCEELGVPQKQIVAIQGPFSKELNKALYAQYEVTVMVTKETGKAGAFDEKVEAALEMGIEVIVIDRPTIEYGSQFSEYTGVIQQLNKFLRGGN
ncbi:precorrin-6A reductase [Brevibacillus ginsengisoli]|uniref:precorrin-6A reductase n=1 Tax=Brevibacillus ginsengisoli TaxID=363854 RepID=UPI003CEBADE2